MSIPIYCPLHKVISADHIGNAACYRAYGVKSFHRAFLQFGLGFLHRFHSDADDCRGNGSRNYSRGDFDSVF